jgi:tRNA threonylcarbamoyladenosine biosynthesis protein TsaE
MHSRILLLPDAHATENLGRALSRALTGGMVVTLTGELGAGKTTLVRGVLRGLDIAGPVKSPTYTLVEPYAISSLHLYHFDFYRLRDPDEWEEAGFREYFRNDAICMIEWPDKAGPALPRPDLAIALEIEGDAASGRRCTLSAFTERAERCLTAADQLSRRTSGRDPASSSSAADS